MTELSGELVDRISAWFEPARDASRAAPMAAYMKDQFPFIGLPAPTLNALLREATVDLPPPARGVMTEADLADLTVELWGRDEREYQYAAMWIVRRYQSVLTPAFLPTAEWAITTKSWWDTVDTLAQRVVGHIVFEHRDLEALMTEWLSSENLWLARTSILHQERWKEATDPDVLFTACLARADDREFFIRKAIGWALRSYSYVDPDAVEAFVDEHAHELSSLSTREAMKAIDRSRA